MIIFEIHLKTKIEIQRNYSENSMEGKFGMEGIPETENFTERIGTEAGARWSDVLYKGILLYKLWSMKI